MHSCAILLFVQARGLDSPAKSALRRDGSGGAAGFLQQHQASRLYFGPWFPEKTDSEKCSGSGRMSFKRGSVR